ncbi:MAG: hypothetical protein M3Z19_01225 [Chloroflexota bacterium]|nr:hypothetical protein [Chloroflexota bacterium]
MKLAQEHLDRLVESVELLAADFDVQRSVLPAFVHVPDEVALTFDSAMAAIDQIGDAGLLTSKQIDFLAKINAILDTMSGSEHASFWTPDAMKHDPVWNEVRMLARKALHSLGQHVRDPDLGWMHYVPSSRTG